MNQPLTLNPALVDVLEKPPARLRPPAEVEPPRYLQEKPWRPGKS